LDEEAKLEKQENSGLGFRQQDHVSVYTRSNIIPLLNFERS
jgi:hypothetical protein